MHVIWLEMLRKLIHYFLVEILKSCFLFFYDIFVFFDELDDHALFFIDGFCVIKVSHGVKFGFVFFEFGFTLIKSGVFGVIVGFLREKKLIIHCVAFFIMKRLELKLLIGDFLGYFLDGVKR
jgi:hypothetical protein